MDALTKTLCTSKLRRAPLAWLIAGWFALFLIAVQAYKGSALVYILFSVVYLALQVGAFFRQRTYGYTFLATFLWLGFWLKVSWHLAWGTGYPESTGQFTGSATQWDHALIVSTVGALAVLCARLIFEVLPGQNQTLRGGEIDPPQWLRGLKRWHWALFVLTVVSIALANFHFQIFVVGFGTGTVLMWPLNALITLMLVGGGFSAWMAVLLWYEIHWRGAVFPLLILLIAAAFAITALSLSRGMIVMLLAPLAYAIYLNRRLLTGQSRRRLAVLLLVLCASVVANFFAITHLRERMYFQEPGLVVESEADQRIPVAAKPVINLREKVAGLVNFSIDRWVGIEGVMAVSAYPGLGESLFVHALAETPIKAEPSIYSEIAPWPHQQGASLRKGVSFMSLPGAIAFLFYAGSLWWLFALMALVVLALQYVEVLVFTVTRNPLLCANVAWLLALMIAHFGGAPKAQVPSLVFLSMAVVLIAGLQSRWFDSFARRFRTHS